MKKNFLEDEVVYKAYNKWLNSPTLINHPQDRECLYRFIRACVRYVKNIKFVKKAEAWESIDLRALRQDLSRRIMNEDELITVFSKIEMLMEYEQIK